MELTSIIGKANQMYTDISTNGPSAIGALFLKGENFSQQIKFDQTEEYIKKMLIAQMKLSSMLHAHKYQNQGFDSIPQFESELKKIQEAFKNSEYLKFDVNTVESLFGNPLNIKTEVEAENWNRFFYFIDSNGKNFDRIFNEERFMVKQENEKNPIKKFLGSFQYNRMRKKLLLEDICAKKTREIIRNQFQDNPDDEIAVYKNCSQMIEGFLGEYQSLRGIDDIARMVLKSLSQKADEPIDIVQTSESLREEFKKNESMEKVKKGYRQRDIVLGNKPYDQVPFDEVPEAIDELQKRYEEAFYKEQSPEDYVRDLAQIVSDFVYLQPFEDGNKRTAISLFNSMMMSKGLIPPPISITNEYEVGEAFEKAKVKDYDDLQEIFVKKYHENLNIDNSENEKQSCRTLDFEKD